MDAILVSAKPSLVEVDDAIRHLAEHQNLYWEVPFRIEKKGFSFPIFCFIHISRKQVEYRALISDIIPFSLSHYEDKTLAEQVKPKPWLREWEENLKDIRSYGWKNALVMTEIIPFSFYTKAFHKLDGTHVRHPPQSYVRVVPPSHGEVNVGLKSSIPPPPERLLEDFIVPQLETIEPGLRLEKRQLSTPAGRLDLLCRDASGNYVVVELKRTEGTDRVVGQILRYMGYLIETYGTEKVRGIVLVAKKDQALMYAVKAVPNVTIREFKIYVE